MRDTLITLSEVIQRQEIMLSTMQSQLTIVTYQTHIQSWKHGLIYVTMYVIGYGSYWLFHA